MLNITGHGHVSWLSLQAPSMDGNTECIEQVFFHDHFNFFLTFLWCYCCTDRRAAHTCGVDSWRVGCMLVAVLVHIWLWHTRGNTLTCNIRDYACRLLTFFFNHGACGMVQGPKVLTLCHWLIPCLLFWLERLQNCLQRSKWKKIDELRMRIATAWLLMGVHMTKVSQGQEASDRG